VRGYLQPSSIDDDRAHFWLFQAGGWGVFFAAMFLAGLGQWSPGFTLYRKASLTLIGLILSLLLRYPYRSLRKASLPAVALVAVSLSCIAAGAWMALNNLLLAGFVAATHGHSALSALTSFPDFNNTIYYAFVLIAWSALYFGLPSMSEQKRNRERMLTIEALAHRERLRALRFQLNPHFLFNSLNSVSTLIAEGRNREANRMLGRVSEFLRMTLDSDDAAEVSVASEMDFVRRYLDIEKGRFGDRLTIHITIADDVDQALVPPMILQPIVENAVRYAVVPRENGGAVSIRASREDSSLMLRVDDDGPGIDELRGGMGIGLTNVRERLSQMYARDADVQFERSVQGGLSVAIRLPFREVLA
jgi:two-component system LytT family sensor kinase